VEESLILDKHDFLCDATGMLANKTSKVIEAVMKEPNQESKANQRKKESTI